MCIRDRFCIHLQVLGVAGSLGTGLGGPRARRHEETPLSPSLRASQGSGTFLHPVRAETTGTGRTVQTMREHAEESVETVDG